MKHLAVVAAIIALLVTSGSPAYAQGVATSFDQLSVLVNAGDKITVVDAAGTKTEGRVGALTPDRLTLITPAGPWELTEGDISQVRQRRDDSLRNGALIGAAAGAGYGVALLVLAAAISDGGGPIPISVVKGMTLITGLGAAAGAGIDALIVRQQTIYRRPGTASRFSLSPLVGPGRRGAAFTVRF